MPDYFRDSIENRSSTKLTCPADGLTTDDLYYKWDAKEGSDELAVAIGDELTMSQFAVDGTSVNDITASYVTGTGNTDFSPYCSHDIFVSY